MKKSRSQTTGRTGTNNSRSSAASAGSRSKITGNTKSTTASKSASATKNAKKSAPAARTSQKATAPTKKSATSGSKARAATKAAPASKSKASPKSTAASRSKAAPGSAASATKKSAPANRSRTKQKSPQEGLLDVLKDSLKDIYYAEKQLAKALKKVSKAATNQELSQAFDHHREQTEGHVQMLEQAFEAMSMRAAGKKCPAMDGLIEEANEHIKEMGKGHALDAALIVGTQKIEHYEIAAYGSMRTFARDLSLPQCADIFSQILEQESQTDELLTQIAQKVNQEALMAGNEGSEARDQGNMEES